TALATWLSKILPEIGNIISSFTWVVIIVTALGVAFSMTGFRKLEGAGASQVGSVFLYLLITVIGAGAEFKRMFDAPGALVIGAVWMAFHAGMLLFVRRLLKAPVFFLAVGSQANIGGAA